MQLACLDLEGVLIPEIWVNVAKKTQIDELLVTTRDIPDYDELMQLRLSILDKHGLTISVIQEVIDTLTPLDGAKEFLDWLKARFQVIILSDTFYEFAAPLMRQLDYPTLFCHKLEIEESGRISDYTLRTTMLNEADRGILFCPPQNVIDEFPQFPVTTNYEELKAAFLKAQEEITAG